MNPEKFIQQQMYPIIDGQLNSLRCIDDRYSSEHQPLAHYAVPGGGLGIVADIIAGFEAVLSRALTNEECEIVWSTAYVHIGMPTFHTAQKKEDTLPPFSPVQGCGYCVDTLEGKSNISKTSAAFLKTKATEISFEGYQPTCFHDKHSAHFIVVVTGTSIGMIPTAPDGTRAYVLHTDVRTQLLTAITEGVYEQFVQKALINSSVLSVEGAFTVVSKIATDRLDVVVKNLGAENFQIHIVSEENGKISIAA